MFGMPGTGGSDDTSDTVSDVAAKAASVASEVGGANGFGGPLMDGYFDHMPLHVGFDSEGDLAPASGGLAIHLHNESDEHCEFHLSYFASHMGLEDQLLDVEVEAGETVTIDLPCSEIVGVGPLAAPGETGCHLASGLAVPNTMAVPGFFGQDYTCDGTYEISLAPDVDDLDNDGDTEELILLSDGMVFHMMDRGPFGHMHGHGFGMMGPHKGNSTPGPADCASDAHRPLPCSPDLAGKEGGQPKSVG
jgi:hypothetical protein